MNSLGDILRGARERQGRSLDDVAAATRINKKFLQEIESGEAPKLPETYWRAFIRSYAMEVGVDPNNLFPGEMPKYQPAAHETTPSAIRSADAVPVPLSTPVSAGVNIAAGSVKKGAGVKGNPTLIMFAVVLMGIAGLIAIILWMRNEREHRPAQEISFADVVRDREAKENPSPAAVVDSFAINHPVVGRDSLTLEASTSTDSVWVRVVPDSGLGREIVLPPQTQARWRARYHFALSVGNAQAISFRLNGKPLGALSSVPKAMSNIMYSWSTLDTMQSAAAKPVITPASVTGTQKVQEQSAPPAHNRVTSRGVMRRGGKKKP